MACLAFRQSLAGVKRVVELDGKFSNRAKGEDKPDKAGTAFPDNEVYRGVCSNHICEAWPDLAEFGLIWPAWPAWPRI